MKIYSWDQVRELELPDLESIVEGRIFKGESILLAAREKAGKGLLMLHLAVSVAMGEPFLGRDVRQGAAMYIALEESLRTVRTRLEALLGDRSDVPLYVASADGDASPFRLEDPLSIQWLTDMITEHGLLLVVLDVLREAHEGQENESDSMAPLLSSVRSITRATGATIIVTHHSSRAGGPRGSTSIPAAFDSVMIFVREDEDDDPSMRGLLSGRGRDLPKFAQRIEFDPESHHWRAIEGAPLHSQPTNIREKIIKVVNSTDDWLTAEEITDRVPGTKLQTVRNKLSDMVAENYRQVLVRGTGTKGDPRRYHGIHKREETIANSSGNNPVTNGHRPGPACVECGVPIRAGQLYCEKHGGKDGELIATGNLAWDETSDWKEAS